MEADSPRMLLDRANSSLRDEDFGRAGGCAQERPLAAPRLPSALPSPIPPPRRRYRVHVHLQVLHGALAPYTIRKCGVVSRRSSDVTLRRRESKTVRPPLLVYRPHFSISWRETSIYPARSPAISASRTIAHLLLHPASRRPSFIIFLCEPTARPLSAYTRAQVSSGRLGCGAHRARSLAKSYRSPVGWNKGQQ
ncbi:hypothetical protein MSAN_00271700 [Mycena sanguinolenta]|uniref:Uncharacterized protein n=1 Tax=Mycena sanguinolenta TaxID=230812 RepID=A0A8H7DM09_9AGAR|nr:hypothetical protein MSAN_00271700 [Mycena sanguinolenta]